MARLYVRTDEARTQSDLGPTLPASTHLPAPRTAEALRVTASRLQATQFDAGDFVGSELFVERREKIVLPLR